VVGVALTALGGATLGAAAGAAAHQIDVIVSFFPLAEAAQQVGGGAVSVRNLTPPGAEPHDLELTPDDRETIDDADLVIVLGGGFQPAIEDAAEQRNGATLDVIDELETADRERALTDPHLWLDPLQMERIVEHVERALAEAAPGAGERFARRATNYRADLAALDADFETGLADCDRNLIVTAHDAFGWLAGRYGLRQEGVAGIDPESEPGPERVAELADLVERTGTTTVFTEELVSPDVAETLAREAGVKTKVLSPLEGLTDRQQENRATYISVMRTNLRKLRAALACS
jgi:zinc transport system substrate-binding protein